MEDVEKKSPDDLMAATAELLKKDKAGDDTETVLALELEASLREEANALLPKDQKAAMELFTLARRIRNRLGKKKFDKKYDLLVAHKFNPPLTDSHEPARLTSVTVGKMTTTVSGQIITLTAGVRLGIQLDRSDKRVSPDLPERVVWEDLDNLDKMERKIRAAERRSDELAQYLSLQAAVQELKDVEEMRGYLIKDRTGYNAREEMDIEFLGEATIEDEIVATRLFTVSDKPEIIMEGIRSQLTIISNRILSANLYGRVIGSVRDGGKKRAR